MTVSSRTLGEISIGNFQRNFYAILSKDWPGKLKLIFGILRIESRPSGQFFGHIGAILIREKDLSRVHKTHHFQHPQQETSRTRRVSFIVQILPTPYKFGVDGPTNRDVNSEVWRHWYKRHGHTVLCPSRDRPPYGHATTGVGSSGSVQACSACLLFTNSLLMTAVVCAPNLVKHRTLGLRPRS